MVQGLKRVLYTVPQKSSSEDLNRHPQKLDRLKEAWAANRPSPPQQPVLDRAAQPTLRGGWCRWRCCAVSGAAGGGAVAAAAPRDSNAFRVSHDCPNCLLHCGGWVRELVGGMG